LDAGDVLAFDYPIGRMVDLVINGKGKYRGRIVSAGNKRAFQIDEIANS
jgi:flagellar motor switch protein FliM